MRGRKYENPGKLKTRVDRQIRGSDEDLLVAARRSRLMIVQLMFDCGSINKEEAEKCLFGCVLFDDMTTYFDDRSLLKENDNG